MFELFNAQGVLLSYGHYAELKMYAITEHLSIYTILPVA